MGTAAKVNTARIMDMRSVNTGHREVRRFIKVPLSNAGAVYVNKGHGAD
jgi:hypothetical protein